MKETIAFLIGIMWGISVLVVVHLLNQHWHRHQWKCPACEFEVVGKDQGIVDYVILEHSASHERT